MCTAVGLVLAGTSPFCNVTQKNKLLLLLLYKMVVDFLRV